MTSPPGFESNPTLRGRIAKVTDDIEKIMSTLDGHLECERLCGDRINADAVADSINDYSLLLVMAKIIENRAITMLARRDHSGQN
jgi:hypothetical protein